MAQRIDAKPRSDHRNGMKSKSSYDLFERTSSLFSFYEVGSSPDVSFNHITPFLRGESPVAEE